MTKEFLRSNFIVLCLGTLLILLYPILKIPKGEFELLINRHHTPFLDIFFKYFTHFGDGALLAIFLIAMLFYNYSTAILTSFTIVFQSIFVSIFKRWIFKGLARPIAFFDNGIGLNFVDGVDVHSTNTFPSGHTATGFALFALIFIVIKNRGIIVATFLFVAAFLVGLSRVYLLQHFLIDVYFGALIGVLSVVLGLVTMEKIFNENRLHRFKQTSLRTSLRSKQAPS